MATQLYEGDYRCEVSGDSRCQNVATHVLREPYTPAKFKLLTCDDHSDGMEAIGYQRDLEAEEQLGADKQREAEAHVNE